MLKTPSNIQNVERSVPKKRQELLKTNGWGYKDTRFEFTDKTILCHGGRYMFPDKSSFETFRTIVGEKFFYDEVIDDVPVEIKEYPEPKLEPEFMEAIQRAKVDHTTEGEDRLFRSHGQTMHEIFNIRAGKFSRIPDVVLWPTNHDEVVHIVKLANEHNVVLIPFGGGTTVSGSVTCPEDQRSIVVLDTSEMNRMIWLDKANLVACFESGIIGQDLEKCLSKHGYTMGHEPDSSEFSSLGGWVATRASGMKKNKYGNIEDIVVKIKMVTSKGVLEKNVIAPRQSCGPDFDHIVFGSEGTLGVITEVVVKIRPLPEVLKYGALIFPGFSEGFKCIREVAKRRCQCASIRLVDNVHFTMGQALKPDAGFIGKFIDKAKMFALSMIKGYDLKKLCVVTMLFEGNKDEVEMQEKLIYEIADKYSGYNAGPENGKKGYNMTFLIAYIRDFMMDKSTIGESFETSVAWDKCEQLCYNTKTCVENECKRRGIKLFEISYRVTQTYDAGACVYFYFVFRVKNMTNPLDVFEEIENLARDEILASGGSISHHHGIGKIRAKWYKQSVSDVGVKLFKATKKELDPRNIFAVGNILSPEEQIDYQPTSSKL